MELIHKYRPAKFNDMIGQGPAVTVARSIIKAKSPPHTMLISGPSGCGKTTLARIMVKKFGPIDKDIIEINTADFGGIEMVREMRGTVQKFGMYGRKRGWVIDEAHKLTNDAQNALLKILEEPPDHCFFFLCTTEPSKLIGPLQQRCTHIKLEPVVDADIKKLLLEVAKKEKIKLSNREIRQIVVTANCSPRTALKLLDAVSKLDKESDRLACLVSADTQTLSFEIYKCLIASKKWEHFREKVATIKEDYEAARRIILACANTTMISGTGANIQRAYLIAQAFRDNFFDCGKAGLAIACMELSTAINQ